MWVVMKGLLFYGSQTILLKYFQGLSKLIDHMVMTPKNFSQKSFDLYCLNTFKSYCFPQKNARGV